MQTLSSNSTDWKKILSIIGKSITRENCTNYDWEINYFREQYARYLLTLQLIERYLKDFSNPSILDIGAFPLHISAALKIAGYKVVSIDIDPYRSKLNEIFDLDVLKIDIEKERIPKTLGKFHIVLFLEVLEHLRIDPIKVLRDIRFRLERGGLLIMSTPNLYSFHGMLTYLRGRGLTGSSTYGEWMKIEQVGHMGHIREYSEYEIRHLLNRTGFRVLKTNKHHFSSPSKNLKNLLAFLIMTILPSFRSFIFCISQKFM